MMAILKCVCGINIYVPSKHGSSLVLVFIIIHHEAIGSEGETDSLLREANQKSQMWIQRNSV